MWSMTVIYHIFFILPFQKTKEEMAAAASFESDERKVL